MQTKSFKEELIEEFNRVFSHKTDIMQRPYHLHRPLSITILGSSLTLFSGQYLCALQDYGVDLLFKPTHQSAIECYYLEKKESYTYHFYHFEEPAPADRDHWSYGLWQVLHAWQSKYKLCKGMLLLFSNGASGVPYDDIFGTPLAMQLMIFQMLHIYVKENPLWLEMERRNEQLEMIYFAQEYLLAPHQSLPQRLGMLHSMVLLNHNRHAILYTNQQTLEPRLVQWSIAHHHLWAVQIQGLGRTLREIYRQRLEEVDAITMILQSLGLSKQEIPHLTYVWLQEHQSAIPEHLYRELRHIIFENIRVFELAQALELADLEEVIRLLNQSHASLCEDYGYTFDALREVSTFIRSFAVVKALRLASKVTGTFLLVIEDDAEAIEYFFGQLRLRYPEHGPIALTNYHKIVL